MRIVLLFLTSFLLCALLVQVNHILAGAHVYLFAGGLYLAYAALTLPLRAGLFATLLAGLLCDARAPLASDLSALGYAIAHTHTLLFLFAHAVVFNLRDRLPRDESTARVIVALLANLGLFLLFSFVHIGRLPDPAAAWPRLIVDLACSQIFIALVAPWFFALQARTLALVGAKRDTFA